MKKRAMKKWIPDNTPYCYQGLLGKASYKPCKWWCKNKAKRDFNNGYCIYMGRGDWNMNYSSLLWDQCKECNIKE